MSTGSGQVHSDDGARVGSGAGWASGMDALVVRPGPLGRHRLTGRFRPQVSSCSIPRARACPRGSGGPARARGPHRRILPLQEGPMRGLVAPLGVDRTPSRRLERPRSARGRGPPA